MKRVAPTLVLCAFAGAAFAQPAPQQSDPAAQRAAMEKLAWMAGFWDGQSVTREREGEKKSLSNEWIRLAAGGLAVMIHGKHWRQLPDGARGDVVLETAGMITYDADAKKYKFATQLQDGKSGTFDAVFTGDALSWTLPLTGAHIRYDITRNDRGQWNESGFFCRDGAPCVPFFRMVLDRKGDAP